MSHTFFLQKIKTLKITINENFINNKRISVSEFILL